MLTPRQLTILKALLAIKSECSLSQLSQVSGIQGGCICKDVNAYDASGLLQPTSLEALGYVRRIEVPPDANDVSLFVQITEKGATLLENLKTRRQVLGPSR